MRTGRNNCDKRDDFQAIVPVTFLERWRSFLAVFKQEFRSARVALLIVFLVFATVVAIVAPLFKREMSAGSVRKSAQLKFSVSIVDKEGSFFGKLFGEVVKDIKYLEHVYVDTFEEAKERLDRNETILFFTLPPDLFEQTRTGTVRESIQLYLNPQKPVEASRIGFLVRQYYFSVDRLYSAVFGFQRVFEQLGGGEEESWTRTTQHSINAISAYFKKKSAEDLNKTPSLAKFSHAIAGIMILFAFLPAMGVLTQTSRHYRTDLENRMTLISGDAIPALSRILMGALWWFVLVAPWLIIFRVTGILSNALPMAIVLFSVYLAGALFMLFIGRSRTSTVSIFQVGWLTFFALLFAGGVLYPTDLFPQWLRLSSIYTPIAPAMHAVQAALSTQGVVSLKATLLPFWPVLPALLLVLIGAKRRRA